MSFALKRLRHKAGLTLEALAQVTGLTRRYVSKVERGLSAPSVGGAIKLAQALGVPVERLFGNHSIPEAISITRGSAAVASGGPRIVAGNAGHHRLMAFVLSPGQSGLRQSRMSGHEGEEILDVLRGEVRLHLAGRSERLQAGDCAQFDASIPHRVEPASDGASEVLLVTVKPQEK